MVFSSVFFIFCFLPLFFVAYYSVSYRAKSYVIVIGSYAFYAWWRIDFAGLMLLVTAFTYIVGNAIKEAASAPQAKERQKWLLVLGVAGNLAVLGYFKYANFFVDSLELFINGGEDFDWIWGQVILPIGISFYIFQSISYLIDISRKSAEPPSRFIDFCAFNALFPQLIAGPVLRYKDLADQFYDRVHSWEKFNYGVVRFLLGLGKKVLIADSVAPLADALFDAPEPTLLESWLGALAYSIQLFFDFSGYSSMAIGLGYMLGFKFIENFNSPYISQSITEFWRRWHISLSTWLRDYLYIPLGGNRKGTLRTYINLFLTMLLGGFWHGANATFIIWGAWHGLILGAERYFKIDTSGTRFHLGKWLLTLVFVIVGWVFFRASDVAIAFDMLGGMAGLNGIAFRPDYAWQVKGLAVFALLVGIAAALSEPKLKTLFQFHTTKDAAEEPVIPALLAVTAVVIGVLSVVKLVADSDTPFLYFQF